MLQNYITIAWRNLLRRTFYSLLNMVGLAVGITFALLIGAYCWGEYQVNRSLRNANQQCLVQSQWTEENRGMDITSFAPVGPALKTEYPTLVANYYRFYGVSATISKGENHFRESIQIGDSTMLTMFDFPMLHGDPRTALTGPNSVVITADKAQKLFGKTDVLNQSLIIETPLGGKQPFLVTGVLKPLLDNSVSHLLSENNEVFMSMSGVNFFGNGVFSWQNPYIVTYVELQPGVTPQALEKPLKQLLAKNTPPDVQKSLTAYVTPLPDYYLQSNNGLIRKLMTTLAAVGLFILLMAVVNFVNLSLGTSATRLREIGVRKVLGGLRRQLTAQFLIEAITLTALATGLSIGLYALFQPVFSDVVGKPLPSLGQLLITYGWVLLVLILVVGGLAGTYPALYLSAYSSVDSLKGKARSVREGQWFRRGLVTVQFAIAVSVFVGAVLVSRQIAWFFSSDLGFKKEAVLTVSSLPRTWSPEGVNRMEAARDRFARLPGVQSASLSYEIPNGNVGNAAQVYRQGQDSTQAVNMSVMTTDEQFAQTYQIGVQSGRFFHAEQGSYDSTSLIINESACKALGYKTPEEAIEKLIRFQGIPRTYRIRGVVRDFHVGTMHKAIQPMAIGQVRVASIYRFFSFRLAPGNPRQAIAGLEQTWRDLFPDAPFNYAFMDETLQNLYKTELQLEKAAYVATGLALLIVLLGVVGLVSLSVARRTKEVGIRKVLGASVPGIIGLFLREYAWTMVLANLIAWPLTYWLVSNWLADYAYHMPVTLSPFVLVGAGLALVTAIIISLQVVKAALMNPVTSLRSE
ncbi:ABC transporter permease [Fibrella aquatica]|uniref:ABC transporter permease n=1 Tax=Fibrella aquatica TaxID=3242487 RepID=UPI00351FFD6B